MLFIDMINIIIVFLVIRSMDRILSRQGFSLKSNHSIQLKMILLY